MEQHLVLDSLVERVRQGEKEAYREIVRACEAPVRVVLAAILPDGEAVQDVAQEVFVTAYAKLDEYNLGTDFLAWMKTFARQIALNERKRYLRKLAFERKYRAHIETVTEPQQEQIEHHLGGEVLSALGQCIDGLAAATKDVVKSHYLSDKPCGEIARRFERPESWVRLVLFRARAELGECLKRKGAFTCE